MTQHNKELNLDEDSRRRLCAVYAILLELAREKEGTTVGEGQDAPKAGEEVQE